MTSFYYIPPLGKNRAWRTHIIDGCELKFTVRPTGVKPFVASDEKEQYEIYDKMYPQYANDGKAVFLKKSKA